MNWRSLGSDNSADRSLVKNIEISERQLRWREIRQRREGRAMLLAGVCLIGTLLLSVI